MGLAAQHCTSLEYLGRRGTAATVPTDISSSNVHAIQRYYAQLHAASVQSTKLKLVVMGKGEAGKTSLIQRLKEFESPGLTPRELPSSADRTIGIEMSTLQDTFVVHDFGGQSEVNWMLQPTMAHHLTHPTPT